MRSGRLHIAVFDTGCNPLAVDFPGFRPFATTGFLDWLLAEDIEKNQAETARTTGASRRKRPVYGIQPQVMPRVIGLELRSSRNAPARPRLTVVLLLVLATLLVSGWVSTRIRHAVV